MRSACASPASVSSATRVARATRFAGSPTSCWCPGRPAEAGETIQQALSVLEPVGASPELAMAYATLASLAKDRFDFDGAVSWATRALELAGADRRRRGACTCPEHHRHDRAADRKSRGTGEARAEPGAESAARRARAASAVRSSTSSRSAPTDEPTSSPTATSSRQSRTSASAVSTCGAATCSPFARRSCSTAASGTMRSSSRPSSSRSGLFRPSLGPSGRSSWASCGRAEASRTPTRISKLPSHLPNPRASSCGSRRQRTAASGGRRGSAGDHERVDEVTGAAFELAVQYRADWPLGELAYLALASGASCRGAGRGGRAVRRSDRRRLGPGQRSSGRRWAAHTKPRGRWQTPTTRPTYAARSKRSNGWAPNRPRPWSPRAWASDRCVRINSARTRARIRVGIIQTRFVTANPCSTEPLVLLRLVLHLDRGELAAVPVHRARSPRVPCSAPRRWWSRRRARWSRRPSARPARWSGVSSSGRTSPMYGASSMIVVSLWTRPQVLPRFAKTPRTASLA